MTIRELIDRLKNSQDLNSDIYIATKFIKDETIVANPVKEVFCTNDGVFLEFYKEGGNFSTRKHRANSIDSKAKKVRCIATTYEEKLCEPVEIATLSTPATKLQKLLLTSP